jgi:hypothetical protein
MTLRSKFKAAIEEYSGNGVSSIKLHPDPQVPGTYAIRTKFEGESEHCDWLLVKYNPAWTTSEIQMQLEECEFETWPPISDGLKLFW